MLHVLTSCSLPITAFMLQPFQQNLVPHIACLMAMHVAVDYLILVEECAVAVL